MHLGMVHDDGPGTMVAGERIGLLYVMPHDANDPDNVTLRFRNGKLGDTFPFLRGQILELEEDEINELPVIDNEGYPIIKGIMVGFHDGAVKGCGEPPHKLAHIKYGLGKYEDWRRGKASSFDAAKFLRKFQGEPTAQPK